MKRLNLLKAALLICFVCLSSASYSQDLKSIFGGITDAITSKKATAENIVGTWIYEKPAVDFNSDNLLAKAGGKIASARVEKQLQGVFSKVGMTSGRGTYVFDKDGNYSVSIGKAVSQGTYTFNATDQTITMVTRLGIKTTANVDMSASNMKLLFKVDKLLSTVKTIGSTMSKASSNSSLSILNSLAGQYDGLKAGFELKKK